MLLKNKKEKLEDQRTRDGIRNLRITRVEVIHRDLIPYQFRGGIRIFNDHGMMTKLNKKSIMDFSAHDVKENLNNPESYPSF